MKYAAYLIIFLCSILKIQAQPFSPIPAKNFPITETQLPVFTHRFALGDQYAQNDYSVSLIYPEFAPLSAAEVKMLRQQHFEAGEMPRIDQTLAVSRGQGEMQVHFVPIVQREGKWMRLTNCKIKLDSRPRLQVKANGLSDKAARYAAHSVLAQGKWYKIAVTKEGVYQLTADQIKKMGFTDLDKVKIYGYGGRLLPTVFDFTSPNRMTDDLQEVPTYRNAQGLLFFAEGTMRWDWLRYDNKWKRTPNTFSNKSYYFVTEGEHPLRIQTKRIQLNNNSSRTSTAIVPALYEEDAFAWYEGGTEFFDNYDFINGSNKNFTLATPDASPQQTAHVEVAFSAASPTKSTTATIRFNNHSLGTLSVSSYDGEIENAKESRKTFTVGINEDKSVFNIESTPGNHARLNYILASYYRQLTAKPFVFQPSTVTSTPTTLAIADANAHEQLWMIGRTDEPTVALEGTLKGTSLEVPIDQPDRRYIVVDVNSNYDAPQLEGEVKNQDLHADGSLDMVIIVPSSGRLTAQAERLAAAHTKNGLRVKVVTADQLYNEFSSGTPDATAYRRYLKMLYDRATSSQDMPRYLTLFGGCNWDNRFLITNKTKDITPNNLLLAYEISPSFQSTNISIGTLESFVTDDYYGYLDDGEGANISREQLDLNIGRILCTNEDEARLLVDKALDYLQNKEVGAWKNKVVMMADYGDNNLHMRDCEATVHNIEAADPRINLQKIYWDAYPYTTSATGNSFPQVTKMIQDEIAKGAVMFNYTGHGSPNLISHASLLKTKDFEVPNHGNMPLWVFASCEITPYDQQINDIGRTALYNAKGGAVSVACASRSVYAVYNRAINAAFSKYLFALDEHRRPYAMGEALRKAKNEVVFNGSDRTINKLKYVLLGDPALVLSTPKDTIVIDSINGQAVQNQTFQLSAGQKVRFSGYVMRDKDVMHDFNGKLSATLYDRIERIRSLNNGYKASSPMTFEARQKRLFDGNDSVRNGRFSIEVIVPRNISYSDEHGALYLYAVDNSHRKEGSGISTSFYFNGSVKAEKQDTLGPKTYIYLNTPDFVDGGIVNTQATFGATVVDSAGINAFGAGVGHNIELCLDNDPNQTYVLNSAFSYDFGSTISGRIEYPLNQLTPGKHTLKFRIWDINDNSTTKYLNFTVDSNWKGGLQIEASENPARQSTTFVTSIPQLDSDANMSIEVYDLTGRKMWSQDFAVGQNTPYVNHSWDLTNYSGQPLDRGIYVYRATIRQNGKTTKTKAKKIILVE